MPLARNRAGAVALVGVAFLAGLALGVGEHTTAAATTPDRWVSASR